jgi:hypothetical protein
VKAIVNTKNKQYELFLVFYVVVVAKNKLRDVFERGRPGAGRETSLLILINKKSICYQHSADTVDTARNPLRNRHLH